MRRVRLSLSHLSLSHPSWSRPRATGAGVLPRLLRVVAVGVLAVALVVGVTSLGSPGVAATRPAGARGSAASYAPSYDDLVLHYTNLQRRARGLPALRPASCLDSFATSWTRFMAVHDAYRHQSLRPILRRCHHRTAGENIARGKPALGAAQVVSLWMHSAGHRANILNRRYRFMAVDAWRSSRTGRVYVAQDFAG